jgi:hypothetical protein
MCYHVLQINGQVTARSTTVWSPTNLELQTDEIKATFTAFDEAIANMLKDDEFPVEGEKPDLEAWADLAADRDFREEFFTVYQDPGVKDADDETREPSPAIMDEDYLRMELALPRDGDGPVLARVKKRLKDNNGKPIGVANKNPILDTRVFEVEFLDGHTVSLTANAIAESLFAQLDSDGRRLLLIDEIVDHRKSHDAIDRADGFTVTKSGQKKHRQTTKGWELLVRWKDGSETWTALKDLKEAFIVLVAEYAIQNKIHEEPAFAW